MKPPSLTTRKSRNDRLYSCYLTPVKVLGQIFQSRSNNAESSSGRASDPGPRSVYIVPIRIIFDSGHNINRTLSPWGRRLGE